MKIALFSRAGRRLYCYPVFASLASAEEFVNARGLYRLDGRPVPRVVNEPKRKPLTISELQLQEVALKLYAVYESISGLYRSFECDPDAYSSLRDDLPLLNAVARRALYEEEVVEKLLAALYEAKLNVKKGGKQC